MKGSKKKRIFGLLQIILVCALLLGIGASVEVGSQQVPVEEKSFLGETDAGRAKNVYIPEEVTESGDVRSMNAASLGKKPPVADIESQGRWSVVTLGNGRFGGARVWLLNSAAVLSGSDAVPVLQETQQVSASDASAAAAQQQVSASDAGTPESFMSYSIQPHVQVYSGTLRASQNVKYDGMDEVFGTVKIYESDRLIQTHNQSGYKDYSNAIADGTAMSVTVTAPEGYSISSVRLNNNETPAAKESYNLLDTTQEYTFDFYGQLINVTYTANPVYVRMKNTTDSPLGITTADAVLSSTKDELSASSTTLDAHGGQKEWVTYAPDSTQLRSLVIDPSNMSCEYEISSITVEKNGKVWDALDIPKGALPLGSDDGVLNIPFKDGADINTGADSETVTYVNIEYRAARSTFDVEHINNVTSDASDKTLAAVTLNVENGETQTGGTSATVKATDKDYNFTVSTGATLSSLTLSGNVFSNNFGLGITGIRVLKDDQEWDVLDDSSVTYPITAQTTINFKKDTVMPEEDVTLELTYDTTYSKFTLEQGYDDSVNPKPETLGTVAIATNQTSILNSSGTSYVYEASIGSAKSSGTGIMRPNAVMDYVKVTPPSYYSVQDVRIRLNGVDVTQDAINWERASTVTPSTGTWALYFKSGYSVPTGSVLEVEAEYGSWMSYELRHSYSDSDDPRPAKLGTLLIGANQPSFRVNGTSGLVYDASINSTQESGTGTIMPDAKMNYIKATPPTNYSVRSVKILVDGEDVTQEAINWNHSSTETPSTGTWTLYFVSGYTVHAGSTIEVEAQYGGWKSYELRHSYSDSDDPRPAKLGTLLISTQQPGFIASSGTGLVYDVSINSTQESGTGLIKPDSQMNYVKATPPSNYSVRSIKIIVDGKDVTDEAIDWKKTTTVTPSTGTWMLYFVSGYTVPDGSTIEVEAEYGGWESYELRQKYSDSVDPKPEKLGTLLISTEQPGFIASSGTGLAYDASINAAQESGTGLIMPDAQMNYVKATPPSNYSVRSIKIIVDGKDVTDEAINWNHSSTAAPSTGTWMLYFAEGYIVSDGSTIEVEAEYGGWESYELRQKYSDSVDPKPEKLGTLLISTEQPGFVGSSGTGLVYDASINATQESGTGLIKPDAQMDYIKATPPSNYSVRKVNVFVDGKDVTDEAINWNHSSTAAPSTGTWMLYFTEGYIVPDGSTIEVEAEYGGWESYELRQKYSDSVDPKPEKLGTLLISTERPGFVGSSGTGLVYDASINATQESGTGLIKPDAQMDYIKATPPSNYSVRKVNVFVDGKDVTDEAIDWEKTTTETPSTGTWMLYFTEGYIVPDGSTIEVEAEYGGWESYELRQKYADYITPKPEKLGTLLISTERPGFVGSSGTGLVYDASINATQESGTGLIKPDAQMDYIKATPPSNYSVRKVNVFVDGKDVTDEAIDWEKTTTVTPSTGTWMLYFVSGYTVPDGSTIEVEAEYGGWESYELRQKYSDSVDPKPEKFGTLLISTERPGFVGGSGTGLVYDASINAAQESGTGLIKPDTQMDYIKATPPSNYSVRKVNVFVDGKDVTDEAIDWEKTTTVTPSTGTWMLYFVSGYTVPDGSTIEVEAEYGGWESYELRQKYSDSVDPKPEKFGTLLISTERPGFVGGSGTGLVYDASINAAQESGTGLIKPDTQMDYIKATPPIGYSVVGLDIYVDGVLAEDAIDWNKDATTAPVTGEWRLYFNEGYTVPDGSSIRVEATYGEWCVFTIIQKFSDSVDPQPATLGRVSVNADLPAFKVSNGLVYSADLSPSMSKYEGNLRPDRELVDIRVEPPVNSSVVSVDVYVDGVLDETAIDYSHENTLIPTSGSWRVYFRQDFTAPVSSEVEIIVTYGDWYDITLRQTNLLGGTLGKVNVTSDRYDAFNRAASKARDFSINGIESDTRMIHPDAQLKTLEITAPKNLSVLEAKAVITRDSVTTEWEKDGEKVLTLNEDGTVTLLPIKADGDVTIEVTYGSRMYVKSNVADVVAVDSTKADIDFAKLCDLTAAEKTFGITVKDGWRIDSVYYGTSESTQNTVLTAQNSDYKVSSIASDIYLLVNVVRDDRILSARTDGTGEAGIVYGGTTTPLTGTAQVIDDAVQIDSTVTFEIIAGADTNILDVTLNGTSLGSVREFIMPDTDSEIVVYTELVKIDKASIKAVLTGDGEAEAAYGSDVITLETTEKIIATDLTTGIYEVTFRPAPGSEIVAVTLNGAQLGLKNGEENVYLVPVAGEDVLVTVETSKIKQYKVYAKANIADAAQLDGTTLTTDYTEIISVYENEDAAFAVTCSAAYEITQVKCGDTQDSLEVIEADDGSCLISALTADKYVEVTLAKKPVITVNRTGGGVVYTNGGSEDISGTSYTVAVGSDHTFSFIPYSGAELRTVTVKLGTDEAITVYDLSQGGAITRSVSLDTGKQWDMPIADLAQDCTIDAVFTDQPDYTLYVIKKGDGEGTFTYEETSYTGSFDVTVTHGSTPTLTIKAKGGSKIVGVMVGDTEETAEKIDFGGSSLTLPEVTKDVYVVVEFEKIPSGGTPQTGDAVIAGTVINLFVISSLVCVYYVFCSRKSKETA